MYIFLMVVHIFVSMVLILVILMQAGRGGGMSEVFGGSSTQTIFGTSTAKFLMRATAACAVLFIVTSLSLAALSAKRSRSLMESVKGLPMGTEEVEGVSQEEVQEETMPVEDEKEPIEPKTE